jgi:hypothetical protein
MDDYKIVSLLHWERILQDVKDALFHVRWETGSFLVS